MCSRIRVLHCYGVYRSPGYVPSIRAGEQSASFSVWANWRRDFPAPAAMSGLGNGPHIGLVTSGGSVPQSPDEGRPSRHGDRAAPVLILPLATVVAADAFAGELRWQVGSCGDAEFAVGVTQVGFDGGLGDEQVLGDLPVG